MRLTRPNVARLAVPAGRTEIIVFDEALPGFGVRVRLSGKRTWIAQYRLGSKQRRVTLGTTDTLDAEEARRRAKSVLGAVHNGDDPQAKKAEARARASITLGMMAANYLERFAADRLRPKTLVETRRYLIVSWKPLHGLGLNEIDRRAVAVRLSEISRENGPIAANRARGRSGAGAQHIAGVDQPRFPHAARHQRPRSSAIAIAAFTMRAGRSCAPGASASLASSASSRLLRRSAMSGQAASAFDCPLNGWPA